MDKIYIDFLPCSNTNKREIFRRVEDIKLVQPKLYDIFGLTRGNNLEIEIGKDRALLYLVLCRK